MDRSEPALPKQTAGDRAPTGSDASILGQPLRLPQRRQSQRGSRGSVYPCCERHQAGGESISARPAIWFPLSHDGYKAERGGGRCTA